MVRETMSGVGISDAAHVFVGRQRELDRLTSSLREPDCRVLVVGEAGVGKTSLVNQVVVDSAARSGVYQGGALATLRWIPYIALQQAFRHVAPRGSNLWSGDSEFVAAAVERQIGDGLLVIDDLQWADTATWSVLELLAGRVRMVTAVRLGDPDAEGSIRRLADWGFDRLEVPPLQRADALAVARHCRPDLAEYEAESIVARSGGIPLVIEELTAGKVASLKLAMAGRLAVLSEAAVADLEMLSLAGHALPIQALPEVEALRTAGMIVEVEGRAEVRHALLAEVIVDGIDQDRVPAVHRQLADVVDEPGARARHLLLAGNRRQGYAEAMIAVELASTPGERAAHLMTAASCASTEQEPGLLLRAARACADAGEIADAFRCLDRIADPGLDAALLRAHLFSESGDSQGWVAALAGAEEKFDRLDVAAAASAASRVTLLAERARAAVLAADDPPAAIEEARLAVAEADQLGERRGLAHYVLGTALYYVADPQCHSELEEAVAFAHQEGDVSVEMRAANNLIVTHEAVGDPTVGRAIAERMERRSADLKMLRWQRHYAAASMNLAVHLGDFDAIIERAPELLAGQMMRRTRDQLVSTYALALVQVGRTDEGVQLAESQLHDSELCRSNLLHIRALAAAYVGDNSSVCELWGPFLEAAENPHRLALAVTLFARAFRGSTCGSAHDELPGLPDLTEACSLPVLYALPVELEALRIEADEPVRAAQLFAEAADLWRPYERHGEIRCRWSQAVALGAAGRTAEATTVLGDAERLAVRHGMRPMVTVIQRSLRELGVRRPGAHTPGLLTARQTEVLRLVGSGLPDADIAARLGLSVRTVQSHIAAARRVLGADNRHQAALLAAELPD